MFVKIKQKMFMELETKFKEENYILILKVHMCRIAITETKKNHKLFRAGKKKQERMDT
jgi:hypothetical protein